MFSGIHHEFGVLGYTEDLDSHDIDENPDFRDVLKIINAMSGVRTVSSCQGHRPGEKYPDVLSPMSPYITIFGDRAHDVAKILQGVPHFERWKSGGEGGEGGGKKILISFSKSVLGKWGEVRAWLLSR